MRVSYSVSVGKSTFRRGVHRVVLSIQNRNYDHFSMGDSESSVYCLASRTNENWKGPYSHLVPWSKIPALSTFVRANTWKSDYLLPHYWGPFLPWCGLSLLVLVLLPLLGLGPVLARPQVVPRQQAATPLLLQRGQRCWTVKTANVSVQRAKLRFHDTKPNPGASIYEVLSVEADRRWSSCTRSPQMVCKNS